MAPGSVVSLEAEQSFCCHWTSVAGFHQSWCAKMLLHTKSKLSKHFPVWIWMSKLTFPWSISQMSGWYIQALSCVIKDENLTFSCGISQIWGRNIWALHHKYEMPETSQEYFDFQSKFQSKFQRNLSKSSPCVLLNNKTYSQCWRLFVAKENWFSLLFVLRCLLPCSQLFSSAPHSTCYQTRDIKFYTSQILHKFLKDSTWPAMNKNIPIQIDNLLVIGELEQLLNWNTLQTNSETTFSNTGKDRSSLCCRITILTSFIVDWPQHLFAPFLSLMSKNIAFSLELFCMNNYLQQKRIVQTIKPIPMVVISTFRQWKATYIFPAVSGKTTLYSLWGRETQMIDARSTVADSTSHHLGNEKSQWKGRNKWEEHKKGTLRKEDRGGWNNFQKQTVKQVEEGWHLSGFFGSYCPHIAQEQFDKSPTT